MLNIRLIFCLMILMIGTVQAALTITSTTQQSGISDWTDNPISITDLTGWDFTSQDYNKLISIDQISITLSISDGDSAAGEFDNGEFTLGLDGFDTGLKLDGFSDKLTVTLTINGSIANSTDVLAALKADGILHGTIIDKSPGDNMLCPPGYYTTTLSITGSETDNSSPQVVPIPSALLLGCIGTGTISWVRKQRFLK